MAEARKLDAKKAFIGGLSHQKTIVTGTDAELKAQVDDTWKGGANRGVIFGPGCGAPPATLWERLLYIKECVEATEKK